MSDSIMDLLYTVEDVEYYGKCMEWIAEVTTNAHATAPRKATAIKKRRKK